MHPPSSAWRLSHFDYHLPPARIAQRPVEVRDRARLLVSMPHAIQDRVFRHLPDWLRPGDLLVLNDTRVLPARLLAHKPSGGRVEILLLKPLPEAGHWEAMASSNKKIALGLSVAIAPGFQATFLDRLPSGFHVHLQTTQETVAAAIQHHGLLPLPPYITGSDPRQDQYRYQTVFARHPGAVAAPTAGLHFTVPLLARLRAQGIQTTTVTLHVGPGTFQPVREEQLARHRMHREQCFLSRQTAHLINATRARQGRVIAVGTTALRVLETAARPSGQVQPFAGETGLFILPGYRFRTVDALITNFHLPRSTLLMLVAALIGKRRLDRDYAHAIAHGYRFYSYGDAQLLLTQGKPG
ncbi:MAG: tRNA preQ1(34) S-adenosylmethionine ribosyltransferase-isomerase QueA [Magnetococcales bacterium]|nr:tRNA preQ1(34) S-adenosylmethionine ribosyltransferase-isomerase QueA [Magnetococcales bacterium]